MTNSIVRILDPFNEFLHYVKQLKHSNGQTNTETLIISAPIMMLNQINQY